MRKHKGVVVLLFLGTLLAAPQLAVAESAGDRFGQPDHDRSWSDNTGSLGRELRLFSPRGPSGRTCETERGACPMAMPLPLSSICTCSISGSVVSGYVRF
jgi:hypothetical protein